MSPAPEAEAETSICAQCGARFRCGMEAGDQECWCASLPALLPIPANTDSGTTVASCLCPACLKARVGSGLKEAI